MATARQRTTGATRIIGPALVTLRGAASKGHEAQTVGAGADVGLSIQIPTGQTANAFTIEKPDGTVIYSVDANGNVASSSTTKVVSKKVRVPLTAAQITTLNSVPVSLVAAPGAGIALVFKQMIFQFIYGTVQFTGGGVVKPVYHGATTDLTVTGGVAAATIQAAAPVTLFLRADPAAGGLAITTNAGLDLTAATADFAAGDSTAVVTIDYDVITLG